MVLAPATHIPLRRLPFDPDWRRTVYDYLEGANPLQERISQRALGEFVGGSQGTVSNILDEKFESSEYVERISAALRIPLPWNARLKLASEVLINAHDDEARAVRIKAVAAMEKAVKQLQDKQSADARATDGKLSPSNDSSSSRK